MPCGRDIKLLHIGGDVACGDREGLEIAHITVSELTVERGKLTIRTERETASAALYGLFFAISSELGQ